MPDTIPAGLSIGTAEPRDAVDAFVARGDLAPTFRWTDVWQEEHASRFMVAGVAQADVLRLIRERVDDAVRKGVNPKDFLDSLKPELQKAGWWGDVVVTDPATGEQRITRFNDARLRLIYDTNLRQSYAAGRFSRAKRNARRLPLLMYRTMRDERVRASHAAWDGLVLPVDHPFWEQHYPPNAWRCRCTAFALSEKDLARRQAAGEKLRTDAPPDVQVSYADPRTGQERTAPLGVDPAFAYNPGETLLQNTSALQRRALATAPPADARALVQQIARPGGQLERMQRAVAADAPIGADEVPVAMRGREPVMLGPDALRRERAALAADPTAPRPLTAAQWVENTQEALDYGVRLRSGSGSTVYVLERADKVVLLELEAVTDATGARVLRVQTMRVMTPASAAADPAAQKLLQRIPRAGVAQDVRAPKVAEPEPGPPAKAAAFEPQRTAKAAGEWAVKNDLVDRADYTGVDPEVANAWNESLFRHQQEFPELRANQRFTGTTQAAVKLWREDAIAKDMDKVRPFRPGYSDKQLRELSERRIKRRQISNSTWAVSYQDDRLISGVSVNKRWGGDVDAWKGRLAANVQSQFHPPGCDTIRSIVDHELGHQLDALLSLAQDGEVKTAFAEARSRGMSSQVSKYAGTNIQEFIAEAWAESLNNPAPRPYATLIASIVRSRYARKFLHGGGSSS